jgi:ribosomal protein S18 acetylase RimI-like enzyme
MIILRLLTPEEYAAYMALGIAEYADDLAHNYRLPADRAATESAQGAAQLLPQGQDTPGHSVLAIAAPDGALIGYLWFSETPGTQSAYINDFLILPENRGKGYGTAALSTLENLMRAKGLRQIRLRVSADNPRAKALYGANGFFTTGTNMAKTL